MHVKNINHMLPLETYRWLSAYQWLLYRKENGKSGGKDWP